MTDLVDTFEHAGLGVRIVWDDCPSDFANPRDCDNLGVMFCDHPHYNLGDDDAPDPRGKDTECPKCQGDDDECERCDGYGMVELSIVDYLKREHGARVILPLFLYDHSGITISAGGRLDTGEDNFNRTGRFVSDGAGWDTSSVGVIFDTEQTRKDHGWEDTITDERIEEILREEVAYYAAYLEGSVYGYQIVGLDGDGEVLTDPNAEVLDSCWGFLELNVFDDDAGVREQARDAAECERRKIDHETQEAAYWSARDVITI